MLLKDIWISIGISLGITLLILTLVLILYNYSKGQPLFSNPWLNDTVILKANMSTNILDLQNQVKLTESSSSVDINDIKTNTIPTVQAILEKSINDLKLLNENSNKEIQEQIDIVNTSLITLQNSIDTDKTELQSQIQSLSNNIQSSITISQENTEKKLQEQIDILKDLVNSENEKIKTNIIPAMKESILILIEQQRNNINENISNSLVELKNTIQNQITNQTLNIDEIRQIINDNKMKSQTESLIINTYTKNGEVIQWTIKGDDNGNLCIGDNIKNFCINKDTGFLF
jgi:hypothetical protein